MRLPKILQRFLLLSLAFLVLCVGIEAVCRFLLHWGYPYDYPFVPAWAIFGDFRSWTTRFAAFHSTGFYQNYGPLMYPAPVAVCYRIFLMNTKSLGHPVAATAGFVTTVILTSWVMLAVVRRALIRRGLTPRSTTGFLLGMYLLSFPFWMEVHQANMEFVVWVTLVVGLWAFWTGRLWLAAAMFGVAGAMKIFPFIFFGLLLVRKQYRETVFGFVVSGATTVASLWLVCPHIGYSFRQTSLALDQFRKQYMLRRLPIESGFDHSLFAVIKRLMHKVPPPQQMEHVLSAYLATAAVLGTIVFFWRIRKLPVINQILCLSVAAILLPPVSYEYTLIHLYVPLVLLVFVVLQRCGKRAESLAVPGLTTAFMLLAFVLSAQSEFIYHQFRYGGAMKALALLALFVIGTIYPFSIEDSGPSGLQPATVR